MLTLLHNSVTCICRSSLSQVYPSYLRTVWCHFQHVAQRWNRLYGHLLVFSRSLPIRSICLPTVLFVLYKHVAAATLINGRDLRLSQVPQEAQLSPRDRAMRLVSSNLANCRATVQKLLIRQVLTELMVWSWRFSRRQCVMNNVHSTMTRPSRLPLSQVS